jgi:hypothetical protein
VLRDYIDRPLTVNSGGRCKFHPSELKRSVPADHQLGLAVDISVSGGAERFEVVKLALELGYNRVGIATNFIHLGYKKGEPSMIWSY